MIAVPSVRVEALTKTYRSGDQQIHALDGVDLVVDAGTVFGLLGSNGAGKSTLIRVLSTLTMPTSGMAQVHGVDVVRDPARVRELIGVTAQRTTLDERLSGSENLQLFGRLHRLRPRAARERAVELLEQFDLAEDADRPVSTYSGGMRRRLDIISSLVLHPRLLFLDEPTTGLDPSSRNDIWTAVRRIRDGGASVLLTTQHLEEADELADRVAVMDRGKILADSTPSGLKMRIGRRLTITLHDPGQVSTGCEVLNALGVIVSVASQGPDPATLTGRVRAGDEGQVTLPRIIGALTAASVAVDDVGLREPTLDEAYLALIGGRS